MLRLRFLLLALVFSLAAAAATYAPADVPDVHRADRTAYVADPDGYVTPGDRTILNQLLANIRRTTSAEPMVVVVGDIPSDTDIGTYATELFSLWGLGKDDKDNGLLIVVAVDARKMAIRTGYGLEGVLPDITCGRIIRDTMRPEFQKGRYGAGLIAATRQINKILTDPQYAEELASARPDTDDAPARQGTDPFMIYVYCSCMLAVVLLVVWLGSMAAVRGRSDEDKYRALASQKPLMLILSFVGLGIPFLVTIPFILVLNHWRNHRRACPHCGTAMTKVDEVNDNSYLTPSQDLEEQVGSVDYDVWLCPQCGETDIIPYVNPSSQLVECDNCHARTARLVANRIVRRPTATHKGQGIKEYECLNCHHRQNRSYDIAPDESGAAIGALGAGILLGASRGRGGGGGFGGGSFGGGFGGGMTGGGGASGGW